MRRFIRPLIVAAALAATVPTGVLSASAATTHPAATRPATASAALVRKLNRLVAEGKLIRIPVSKLPHKTEFRPAEFRTAGRAGAGPARQSHGAAAATAPSCQAAGCIFLDPVTQSNCSVGGGVVMAKSTSIGTIRLMGNTSCESNWAEADGASASAWITAYSIVGDYLYEVAPYNLAPYNYGWSSMVDGLNVNAAACIGLSGQTPTCLVQTSNPGIPLPKTPPYWP
jgi:hypothetical protein